MVFTYKVVSRCACIANETVDLELYTFQFIKIA